MMPVHRSLLVRGSELNPLSKLYMPQRNFVAVTKVVGFERREGFL